MSALGSFCTQLIRFFQELKETYPEEKEIRMALDAIEMAKKANPRLVLDLFYEHVYKDLQEAIKREDDQVIIAYAHAKINTQFNEISPALMIFDRHYPTMTDATRKAVWNYMKVLCILCEKAREARGL
jgi:hypothetical protein